VTDLTPAPQSRRERRALEEAQRTGVTAPPVVVPMSDPVPLVFSTPVAPAPRVAPVMKVAPKPVRNKKSFGARIFPAFAMLFAGALLVGVSVPANAFIDPDVDAALDAPAAASLPAQSLSVDAAAKATTVERGEFRTTSYAQLLQEKYGNVSYNYNVTTGAVRWPFPYAVPISSGYGERAAPCRGCSSVHHGIDFTPGAGAPIYAIASGTVSYTEVSDSGFGNQVMIDHVIKGQKVSSFYGHMAMNSSPLKIGDKVEVGDLVGLVGATGVATGPHLHFEIWLDGAQTNPYVWLKANAVN
jgi:murein DD-endopeptidase MepM/ murein hydrolase activator NlpD